MSDVGSWLLIAARDVDDYAHILEHSGAARRQLGECLREAAQEIARLTECCDAYKGQVKAGDEQILALRDRAKEMQREKVELRQRCDAYKEALEPFAAFADAMETLGRPFPQEGAVYQIHGRAEITREHFRSALATLQDKTP